MNTHNLELAGDAVCSYSVLERSSRVLFSQDTRLQDLLSFFSLLEAIVLYEKILYFPFGDSQGRNAARLGLVSALIEKGVLTIVHDTVVDDCLTNCVQIRKNWEDVLQSIGNIPATAEVSEKETLNRAFKHAFVADSSNYHMWKMIFREDEDNGLFTRKGLSTWRNNILGAVDSYDLGRFMDWENLSGYLARAIFAKTFKADYVTDVIEQPIIQMGSAISQENNAVKLYERLSSNFSPKVEALKKSGYPTVIPVPPIVALILDRSENNPDSVVNQAVALRDEFSTFRVKYLNYTKGLSQPKEKTLGELLDQQADHMDEVTAALDMISGERTDSRIFHELVGGQIKQGDGSANETIDVQPTVSLSGLAKLGIKKWNISKIQGRAQILFDTWRKFRNLSEYHSLVSRKLNITIDNNERKAYEGYVQTVEETLNIRR